jgi:hypothetical protein
VIVTITTTHQPATDLGYLLHKNPATLGSLACGSVRRSLLPEATDERCTAELLIDVDPIGLVRRKGQRSGPREMRRRW